MLVTYGVATSMVRTSFLSSSAPIRKRENASGQHLGDQEMPLTLIERQPVRVVDGIGDLGERFAVG